MVQHTLHIDGTTNVYHKHVHVRVTMHPLTTNSSTTIHIGTSYITHSVLGKCSNVNQLHVRDSPVILSNNEQLLYADDNILQFFNFYIYYINSKIQRPKWKINNDYFPEKQPIYHPAKNCEFPTLFALKMWEQRNFS